MICKTCKGTEIKIRKNYTHGKKSKPSVIQVCRLCGSTNIELTRINNKKKGRKRD